MTKAKNDLYGIFSAVRTLIGKNIAYVDNIPFYQSVDVKYDILWPEETDPKDLTAAFEELIKDIKDDDILLECWTKAVENLTSKEKTDE